MTLEQRILELAALAGRGRDNTAKCWQDNAPYWLGRLQDHIKTLESENKKMKDTLSNLKASL